MKDKVREYEESQGIGKYRALGDAHIILTQADFDRAVAEMSDAEWSRAWRYLGKLVRIRGKRIRELWFNST